MSLLLLFFLLVSRAKHVAPPYVYLVSPSLPLIAGGGETPYNPSTNLFYFSDAHFRYKFGPELPTFGFAQHSGSLNIWSHFFNIWSLSFMSHTSNI